MLQTGAFSPDGSLLVTAGGTRFADETPWEHDGEVCLWDTATKSLVAKFNCHYGCVMCAVFSPDGKSLATTGRDGKMHLWEVAELLAYGEKTNGR